MDLSWHHWPLPRCFPCIQDLAWRDRKTSKILNLCLGRNIKCSSTEPWKSCTHTHAHISVTALKSFLPVLHWAEGISGKVSVEKNGAELSKMMNGNVNGTKAHCSEQHFCYILYGWIYPGSTSNRCVWETKCFLWVKHGRQIATCPLIIMRS